MPPLKLWMHKASPPSSAVMMLADILGLNLEAYEVDMRAKEHLSEEFVKINPMGTVPTLRDGNFVVSESHAIIQYLVEKYGGEKKSALYPFDLETRATIHERMLYDAGVFFVRLKAVAKPTLFFGVNTGPDEAQRSDIVDAYATIEAYLRRGRYVAADQPTIADLSLGSTAFAIQAIQPLDKERFPRVGSWMESLEREPHFEKIMRPSAELFGQLLNMVWATGKPRDDSQ